MNKPFQALMSLSLLGQLFFACQKHKDEPVPNPEPSVLQPGYFVVAPTSRPSSSGGRTSQVNADTKFDLGTLKASKEFLFMLTNGGDQDIFDVTLTTEKEAFDVYPKSIQIVPGKGKTGIVPLLAVGIIHGRQLNGKGVAPTLPPGVNTATVTMKGKTISQKDTIDVSAEFTVIVDAKVAGIKVMQDGIEQKLSQATYGIDRVFHVDGLDHTVTLVNTGNVALRLELYSYHSQPRTIIDLQPSDSKDVSSMMQTYYSALYIEFSDTGAILTTQISNRDSETDIAKIVLLRPY